MSQSDWIAELDGALGGQDEAARYRALKNAPAHRAELLIAHPATLEKVLDATQPGNPVHVRLRALQLVGCVKDANFAYRIEPSLDSSEPHVVAKAVAALTYLNAQEWAAEVLRVLSTTNTPIVRNACLDYFARFELFNAADAFSFVSTAERLLAHTPDDRGLAVRVAEALARQMGGPVPDVTFSLIRQIVGDDNPTAAERILSTLCENAGELYISAHYTCHELGEWIRACSESSNARLAAQALVGFLVLSEPLPNLGGRTALWEALSESSSWVMREWLTALELYRMPMIFNDPEDVRNLTALVGVHGAGDIDDHLKKLLAELGTEEALSYLADTGFEPEGWTKIHIIHNALKHREWTSSVRNLVVRSTADLPDYTLPEGQSFACLALHRAGEIDLDSLVRQFPRKAASWYRVGGASDLTEPLTALARTAKPPLRARLRRIANAVNAALGGEDG
jgi:hypothetical protein